MKPPKLKTAFKGASADSRGLYRIIYGVSGDAYVVDNMGNGIHNVAKVTGETIKSQNGEEKLVKHRYNNCKFAIIEDGDKSYATVYDWDNERLDRIEIRDMETVATKGDATENVLNFANTNNPPDKDYILYKIEKACEQLIYVWLTSSNHTIRGMYNESTDTDEIAACPKHKTMLNLSYVVDVLAECANYYRFDDFDFELLKSKSKSLYKIFKGAEHAENPETLVNDIANSLSNAVCALQKHIDENNLDEDYKYSAHGYDTIHDDVYSRTVTINNPIARLKGASSRLSERTEQINAEMQKKKLTDFKLTSQIQVNETSSIQGSIIYGLANLKRTLLGK